MTTSRYPAWRQAVKDFVEQFEPGDMVDHKWLEAHFGLPALGETIRMTPDEYRERQFEWLASVECFKLELLREHKICLQSVRGQGYRWIPPHEQTGAAMIDLSRGASRLFASTARKLHNLRFDALNEQQRRENVDAITKLASVRGMARRVLA